MPKLLRFTLIAVSVALGVAVALGLALRRPAIAANAKAHPTAAARAVPPAAAEQPAAPAAAPVPTIAPYRDPVAAAQISQLQETMLENEQSAQRRLASVMRAFTSLQGQLAD